VTDQNAHPHTNKDKTIAVVHNGIVENHQELRKMLREKGYDFVVGSRYIPGGSIPQNWGLHRKIYS
jgi:asparagine synthetase B (glutamine-hydrolysing)